jgi:hypothetical protein
MFPKGDFPGKPGRRRSPEWPKWTWGMLPPSARLSRITCGKP